MHKATSKTFASEFADRQRTRIKFSGPPNRCLVRSAASTTSYDETRSSPPCRFFSAENGDWRVRSRISRKIRASALRNRMRPGTKGARDNVSLCFRRERIGMTIGLTFEEYVDVTIPAFA